MSKYNLDILTKKGQATLKEVDHVIQQIKNKWNVDIIKTGEDKPAAIDLFLIKDNILKGLVEVKCRKNTLQQLKNWGDSWLITNEKLKKGAILSGLLKVPFIGILYIVPDNLIYYWKITSEDGEYLFDFDVRETQTQRTVNGGQIIRENAYLPFNYAKLLIK